MEPDRVVANASVAHAVSELEVVAVVEQMLREAGGDRALAALSPEASLERDLGLGSLERMELFSRLEKRFRLELSEGAMSEAELVSDLVRMARVGGRGGSEARRASATESTPWKPSRLGPLHNAQTLGELLFRRAEHEPDRIHIHLTEDGQHAHATREVFFGALFRDALAAGGGLREYGVSRGDTVAIMLPTSYDFFVAFMAAQMIGAIPVPLYPPMNLRRLGDYAKRQARIVANAQAVVFVTIQRGRGIGELLRSRAPTIRHVVSVSELKDVGASLSQPVPTTGDDPAFIQYTSGSTGEPKGVLLSHRNLLANLRVIGDVLAVTPRDVGVSWLPLYHDMGLIGAWLMPLYFGIPVSIFSPLRFIARPERWLWEIHTRRATLSAAPNFAYEISSRKIDEEDLEGLDLSSWRAALNGAEPIAPSTLTRFTKRFAAYGFRREVMMPVYGLAENSLLLSCPELGRGPSVYSVKRAPFESSARVEPAPEADSSALRFVSAGKVVPNHELRVLDKEGRILPEGYEGRLVFKGPSMMRGYYRNAEATEAIRTEEGFFDSGDRGFLLDEEVFVTGRAKDLIIRAGRNLVPHDIEQTLTEIDGLKKGSIVAFGVPSEQAGTEDLVIVAEVRSLTSLSTQDAQARLLDAVRERMVDAYGLVPDEIVLSAPQTVPKTSSGKLRRGECRERYLRGELTESPSRFGVTAQLGWMTFKASCRQLSGRIFELGYGAYVWCVSAAFSLGIWALSFVIPSRLMFQTLVRWAAKTYLGVSFIRLRVEGAEAVPSFTKPLVIVSNHASYLDPLPLLATLTMDYAFVVKQEAWRWPWVGRVIRRLGHLPVERFDLEQSAGSTQAMLRLMSEGRSILIFPEGTFSKATGLRPFKMGAFKLAADAGCPIVPVALVGTRKWLRDERFVPRRTEIRVVFGEPREAGASFAELARLRDEIAEEIAQIVGEPRLDIVTAGYQRP